MKRGPVPLSLDFASQDDDTPSSLATCTGCRRGSISLVLAGACLEMDQRCLRGSRKKSVAYRQISVERFTVHSPRLECPPQLNCCPGRWRTLKTHPSGQFQVADYLLIKCFSEVRDAPTMGEAKQRQSATQKFVAQYPDCCFCGGIRPAVTREHMPPKALFDSSHRPDKLVMPACDECNRGTSTADLVAAVMSRWGYDISVKEGRDHFKLVNRVRRQAPKIVEE
jgi:hypothetical protein